MTELSPPEIQDDPLTEAAQRLDAAVLGVTRRIQTLQAQLDEARESAIAARDSDEDRARLAASLDEARAREAELHQAALQANEALDSAMSDIAGVLGLDEAKS